METGGPVHALHPALVDRFDVDLRLACGQSFQTMGVKGKICDFVVVRISTERLK